MYWFQIVSFLKLNNVLQDSLSLEKLNLTGNNVTGVGALHMARMLIDNDYISELVCSDSQRVSFLCFFPILEIISIDSLICKSILFLVMIQKKYYQA